MILLLLLLHSYFIYTSIYPCSYIFFFFFLYYYCCYFFFFFFSSRRRHTRCLSDWSSDVCSSDLDDLFAFAAAARRAVHHSHLRRPPLGDVVDAGELASVSDAVAVADDRRLEEGDRKSVV